MNGGDDGRRAEQTHEVEIGVLLIAILMIVLVTFGGKIDLSFLF